MLSSLMDFLKILFWATISHWKFSRFPEWKCMMNLSGRSKTKTLLFVVMFVRLWWWWKATSFLESLLSLLSNRTEWFHSIVMCFVWFFSFNSLTFRAGRRHFFLFLKKKKLAIGSRRSVARLSLFLVLNKAVGIYNVYDILIIQFRISFKKITYPWKALVLPKKFSCTNLTS